MSGAPPAARPVRCAIYTRKSHDERGEAGYTSLLAQREYCSAYVRSQGGQGWVEMPAPYDDPGCSGGDLDRPALARLRADVAAGLADAVVVYKIDRLSRSLRDFANLMDEFGAVGATFVSVTQAMDSGTSMGRLTLNVLLSFAQFERELTGERLRDWRAGARARGLWVSDRPYGYAKGPDHRLAPHPEEAPVVRRIFERYCRLGSSRLVADELFAAGILNKAGRPWSANMVLHTIKHRVYRGDMVYRGRGQAGQHEAIVSERLWRRAQQAHRSSRWVRRAGSTSPVPATLKGLVYDPAGQRLHHTFAYGKGRLYRYYIAGGEFRRGDRGPDAYMRFRAEDLERSVLDVVLRMTGSERTKLDWHWQAGYLRLHVARVDLDREGMRIVFRTGAVVEAEAGGRLGPRHAKPTRRGLREPG